MATPVSMTIAARAELGSAWERWTERHLRVLMIAPAMVLLLALTIFPSIYMFVAAFTRISPNPEVPWEFAGADNFLRSGRTWMPIERSFPGLGRRV